MNSYRVKLTRTIEYEATIKAHDGVDAAGQLRVRALGNDVHNVTGARDDPEYIKRDLGVTDIHIHLIAD